jgi:hypothetical protein
MLNLFKLGGSRRKQRSRKNRKSRRRRSYKGGAGGDGLASRANANLASRRV